jgi:SAM-dependent methyltransferase
MTADQATERALAVLRNALNSLPPEADASPYAGDIKYAIRQYGKGLEHYRAVFDRLGFCGMTRGLDIGSGFGNWCLAFLAHNREVVGVEMRQNFADIATQIAANLGYSERCTFHAGLGEEISFPADSFDCAWSAAVLMYTDIELVIRRLASCLQLGAPFYCVLAAPEHRVGLISDGISQHSLDLVRQTTVDLLCSYLTIAGAYCGVFRGDRLGKRNITFHSFARACALFGLSSPTQPDAFDSGIRSSLGIAATFDLLVRKTAPPDAAKTDLLARHAIAGSSRIEELEEIARIGCPRLVCEILRQVDPDLANQQSRDLYARCLIRVGRAVSEEAAAFFAADGSLTDWTLGLYRYDHGEPDAALAHFRRMPDGHPDKAFLVGVCLLQLADWDGARRVFTAALESDLLNDDLREWIGLIAAHSQADDVEGTRYAYRSLVASRRRSGWSEDVIAAELQLLG